MLVVRGRRPLRLGRPRLARCEEGRPLGGAGASPPGGCGPTWAASARRIALGLGLTGDWGSQYRGRQFQTEIQWLGIRSTPAYVAALGEPKEAIRPPIPYEALALSRNRSYRFDSNSTSGWSTFRLGRTIFCPSSPWMACFSVGPSLSAMTSRRTSMM